MSTAAVTLEMTLELRCSGKAAIVFQPLATADFTVDRRPTWRRCCAARARTPARRSSAPTTASATAGWCSTDEDFEDLVVGINVVSQALQDGGYGERILCAVFAFRDAEDQPVYWIYNYKRGAFYPFVPAGGDSAPRHRARAAPQGPDRPRAPRGGRSSSAGSPSGGSPSNQSGIRPSPVNSLPASTNERSGGGRITSDSSSSSSSSLLPVARARAGASPRRPRGSGPRRRRRPPRPPRCRAR